MVGLHLAHFAPPLLRALFFASGLAGCLMVATGALLWAVKDAQEPCTHDLPPRRPHAVRARGWWKRSTWA